MLGYAGIEGVEGDFVCADLTFDAKVSRAAAAARKAGAFLGGQSGGAGRGIVEEGRRDIKIVADGEAETLIKAELGEDVPVLGEEFGWAGAERRDGAYWVVDGLDGTVNFRYEIPFVAVSIGYVVGGQPHIGVVYDFHHDELFAGQVGLGAALNGTAIGVSDCTDIGSALLLSALATKRDFSPHALAEFGTWLGQWRKVRMLGSAALSLAYVAAGRADACELGGIMEWDVAAGLALVRAAGGKTAVTAGTGPNVVDVVADNGRLGKWSAMSMTPFDGR